MNPSRQSPRSYTFSFPRLDTVVEVEAIEDSVVIHASRNTFSPARKACFLRELAAEGFIAEEHAASWKAESVRWKVDPAGFMPDAEHEASTRRFMLRLFFSAVALWLLLMGSLVMSAAR
jgi:hypothetical protein